MLPQRPLFPYWKTSTDHLKDKDDTNRGGEKNSARVPGLLPENENHMSSTFHITSQKLTYDNVKVNSEYIVEEENEPGKKSKLLTSSFDAHAKSKLFTSPPAVNTIPFGTKKIMDVHQDDIDEKIRIDHIALQGTRMTSPTNTPRFASPLDSRELLKQPMHDDCGKRSNLSPSSPRVPLIPTSSNADLFNDEKSLCFIMCHELTECLGKDSQGNPLHQEELSLDPEELSGSMLDGLPEVLCPVQANVIPAESNLFGLTDKCYGEHDVNRFDYCLNEIRSKLKYDSCNIVKQDTTTIDFEKIHPASYSSFSSGLDVFTGNLKKGMCDQNEKTEDVALNVEHDGDREGEALKRQISQALLTLFPVLIMALGFFIFRFITYGIPYQVPEVISDDWMHIASVNISNQTTSNKNQIHIQNNEVTIPPLGQDMSNGQISLMIMESTTPTNYPSGETPMSLSLSYATQRLQEDEENEQYFLDLYPYKSCHQAVKQGWNIPILIALICMSLVSVATLLNQTQFSKSAYFSVYSTTASLFCTPGKNGGSNYRDYNFTDFGDLLLFHVKVQDKLRSSGRTPTRKEYQSTSNEAKITVTGLGDIYLSPYQKLSKDDLIFLLHHFQCSAKQYKSASKKYTLQAALIEKYHQVLQNFSENELKQLLEAKGSEVATNLTKSATKKTDLIRSVLQTGF